MVNQKPLSSDSCGEHALSLWLRIRIGVELFNRNLADNQTHEFLLFLNRQLPKNPLEFEQRISDDLTLSGSGWRLARVASRGHRLAQGFSCQQMTGIRKRQLRMLHHLSQNALGRPVG